MRTIAICLIVGCLGCSSGKPDRASGDPQPGKQPEAQSGTTLAAPGSKLPLLLRAPDFVLLDESGKSFGSDQLLGRAWVVNFMFTRCKATCPVQTRRLADLQADLKNRQSWKDTRLVSITVDPDYDTPQVLHEYALAAQADPAHWKFLTGPKEKIEQLARQGLKLPAEAGGGSGPESIAHSSKFVLIDPQGDVRGFYDSGSSPDVERLQRDLETTLAERVLMIDDLIDPEWMEVRRRAQLGTVDKFSVYYKFAFSDRLRESGIRFRNRIVDDAGREHKPCHYDHGTGIAIADVDGDGLSDVYFVNQVGDNELWRNRGDGTFEDITASAGVANNGTIHVTASFADIDNDGDADLYITNVRGDNVLFENDGKGKFKDITKASGLGYNGHSSAAVFFDYNRDGLLDLFLVNVGVYTTDQTETVVSDRFTGPDQRKYTYHVAFLDAFSGHLKPQRSESSRLFENQGGNRFLDVTRKIELADPCWSGDASPLDVNEDGWPDLYVLNMQGHNEYYENVKGERFVRKSRELFPATSWGAMGIKVFDFDNDGRQDIYITDMHTDMGDAVDPRSPENEKRKTPKEQFLPAILNTDGNHVWGNAFFHKQPDGTFREISDHIGAETYWPWGLSVGDLNADGFEDVFVTASMNFPFRYAVNSVLLNNRGREFLDSEFLLGVEPRRSGRTAVPWFELDVTGKDKAIAELYRSRGVNSSHLVAWGALGTRASVIFDIDNDGDLDILTNDFNSEPLVLISNLTEVTNPVHFLKVRLIGSKSNRDGLGATVKVQAGSQTYTKVHDGKSGYLSQSSYPLYFGLGEIETVDRIEIAWPSGQTQVVSGPISVNTQLELTEP
jgi:cytochrome oxidase Cu insertion factor (SCO1/SenC/PrrC family)